MASKAERLVNLTIALLEARRPVTFEELRGRTDAYAQSDRESARRMFERDKDDLRRLGVPVEVRERALDGELGYLIDRRAYEAPDVDLTPEEVAAIALAIEVAGADDAHLALAKVAARAPDPDGLEVAAATRIDLPATPEGGIAEAVLSRTPIAFAYRTADGRSGARRLDPYALVRRRRAWYVVGRDHDRDDLRAFRLDRVVGEVDAIGAPGAYEPPDDARLLGTVSGPEFAPVAAELVVTPSARWAVEARGAVSTGAEASEALVVRLEGLDPVRDRAWLLGLAPAGVLVGPDDLLVELRAALLRTLELHRADPGVAP
ncbi:MAG: hypothetical protein RLZZ272_1015 [Actinomycetota bacterium]